MSKSIGTVSMTLEAYNELMKEVTLMRQGIKVFKASWDESLLEVEFDPKFFTKEIQNQIDTKFPEGYVISEYVGSPSTTIAKLPKEEEEDI